MCCVRFGKEGEDVLEIECRSILRAWSQVLDRYSKQSRKCSGK